MSDTPIGAKWHLDKRIPIALIVAIAMQTGAGIWWLSSINSRVNSLELQAGPTLAGAASRESRIVRLETQFENLITTMRRIDEKLDRVLESK